MICHSAHPPAPLHENPFNFTNWTPERFVIQPVARSPKRYVIQPVNQRPCTKSYSTYPSMPSHALTRSFIQSMNQCPRMPSFNRLLLLSSAAKVLRPLAPPAPWHYISDLQVLAHTTARRMLEDFLVEFLQLHPCTYMVALPTWGHRPSPVNPPFGAFSTFLTSVHGDCAHPWDYPTI